MENQMPGHTQELLAWLEERYPRPLLRVNPNQDTGGLTLQFYMDTGKRQLIEELRHFWTEQNRR